MKKLVFLWLFTFSFALLHAQFSKASLQATGLTCAMCSNAINKALQKVSFIESVKSDIKNSAFYIEFKTNETVRIDAIKEAVEDAGFSVGSLKLTGEFNNIPVEKNRHVKIGNENFHFLEADHKVLNGEQTVTIIDKNYVTEKQFKKYAHQTKMTCFQTGIASSCCEQEGIAANERVYHVIN
jgi:copper chaperone CopZ